MLLTIPSLYTWQPSTPECGMPQGGPGEQGHELHAHSDSEKLDKARKISPFYELR